MKKYILIPFLLLQFTNQISFAQSHGPLTPGTVINAYAGCLACPGGEWLNLSNVSVADSLSADVQMSSYPMCFQSNCYYTRLLIATNFGFAIPAGAQIKGVVAEVLRKSTAPNGISDTLVQLYSHSPIGINHVSQAWWTQTPVNIIYGDSTDTWGYNFTSDSINQSEFGFCIMVRNRYASSSFSTASIDHIQMTVYYSTGTLIESQTRESNTIKLSYDEFKNNLVIETGLQNISYEKIKSIRVFDISGKDVFSREYIPVADYITFIPLPVINKGIYIAEINFNGKCFYKKFYIGR